MRALILGATGLLGQAMTAASNARGWESAGAARTRAQHTVDVSNLPALIGLVDEVRPDLVINCAALTDVARCEANPGTAYLINARPLAAVSSITRATDVRLVHISTDHYFVGDGSKPHGEGAPVQLVNEYARSKYAGEALALLDPGALVVRTNIVGHRGWAGCPTFAEWVIDTLERNSGIVRFTDSWTSSMHARDCAEAVLDLALGEVTGVVNIAAREVSTKDEFIRALGMELGAAEIRGGTGTVRALEPRRADSLGLDVSLAERLLGRRLPTLAETTRAVVSEHRQYERAA